MEKSGKRQKPGNDESPKTAFFFCPVAGARHFSESAWHQTQNGDEMTHLPNTIRLKRMIQHIGLVAREVTSHA